MPKTYEEKSEIISFRLRMVDLVELTKLIDSAMPEDQDHEFEVRAEFGNVHGTWASMAEFLGHKDLPKTVQDLTIRSWCPPRYYHVREITSDVHISFCGLWSSLSVSGHNETWVIGTHARLSRFFAMLASAETLSIWTRKIADVLKTDLAISLLSGMCAVGLIGVINSLGLAYGTLFAVSAMYLLTKYLTWAKTYAPATTRIELGEERRGWFVGIASVDLVQLALAILGIVLSIVLAIR